MVTYEKNGSSSYALKVGERASKNLDMQHDLIRNDSLKHLRKAGIQQGMVVWDVGCGSGAMTMEIASIVGKRGRVYALDISPQQIRCAKKKIKEAGYENVSFIEGDITQFECSDEQKADIVYSRFILAHLREPEKAIRCMVNLLKPKLGVLSMQEPGNYIGNIVPESPFGQYLDLVMKTGRALGVDYRIGSRLYQICREMSLFKTIENHRTTYNVQEKKEAFLRRCDELQDAIISCGLITLEDYLVLKDDLKKYFDEEIPRAMGLEREQHHVLLYL